MSRLISHTSGEDEWASSDSDVKRQPPVIPGRCEASSPESIAPSQHWEKWIPGPRQEARPGMTAGAKTYPGIPATEFRPGCQKSLAPKIEGAGKAGCRADTHSLACKIKSTRVSSPQVCRNIRLSLRDGFNGFLRALPGEPGLLSPSSSQCAPASGRQDHTTSPSAFAPFVFRHQSVHRIPPNV